MKKPNELPVFDQVDQEYTHRRNDIVIRHRTDQKMMNYVTATKMRVTAILAADPESFDQMADGVEALFGYLNN